MKLLSITCPYGSASVGLSNGIQMRIRAIDQLVDGVGARNGRFDLYELYGGDQ